MKRLRAALFVAFAIVFCLSICHCNNYGKASDDTATGPIVVVHHYQSSFGHLYDTQHNSNYYYWYSDSAITTPASITDSMWHGSTTEPNHRGATQLADDSVAVSAFVNAPNLQMQLDN